MGMRRETFVVGLTLIIFLLMKPIESHESEKDNKPPEDPSQDSPIYRLVNSSTFHYDDPQCGEVEEEKDCTILNDETCEKEELYKCSPHHQTFGSVKKPKDWDCPVSCKDIKDNDQRAEDGLYRVWPTYLDHSVVVYCDMTTNGGGWTVFQRRTEVVIAHTDFDRNWNEYKEGFGNLHGEFWLGNEYISAMSNEYESELLIEMTNFKNVTKIARYNFFRVLSEIEEYKIEVLNYTGNATDELSVHKNEPFRTRDRNENACTTKQSYKSGWWFKSGPAYCFRCNLNGPHTEKTLYGDSYAKISWIGFQTGLKRTEMKMRSKEKYT